MNKKNTYRNERLVSFWSRFLDKRRILIIFSVTLITILSLSTIKNNLSFSTDTSEMLSEKLHWRQLDIQYENLFPQFLDNIIIVIEAQTPDLASDTAQKISTSLKNNNFIKNIYYQSNFSYFKESSFLFLEHDELQDLSDNLAKIQPFLGSLLEDRNLRGLFDMLGDAIEAKQDDKSIQLNPILSEINLAFGDINYSVSWQRLMDPKYEKKNTYREFIELQINTIDDSLLPNENTIEYIRKAIEPYKNSKVNIKLTGGEVLAYEELKSVSNANIKAIFLSIILVATILTIGLGSFRIVVACLTTLIVGLIITTAFASITVGTLNLISIAFAVLYIGLGIDFAIHMALRYREESISELNRTKIIKNTLKFIMKPLVLCALTTAIGFYAFIPTSYTGVAELGWIAGSGMIISFILTITLLPALLSYTSIKTLRSANIIKNNNIINFLCWLPYKYSKIILIFIFLIVSFILLFINKIDFDENRLNLQDPKNESVKTYQELLKDSSTSPWEGILIVESADQTNLKKNEIKLLPLVDNAISIHNLIPEEQNDKLIIIDEMSLLMGNLENRSSELEISKNHRIAAIKKLKTILDNYLVHNSDNQMILLNSNLNNLLSNLNDDDDKKIKAIENQFLENFPGRIKALSDALNAEEVTINNIPDEIYKRWVSDEKYLIKILPKEDLNNNISMRNFVYQLQDFNKDVIGSPIISIEAGNAVKSAFKFAFLCAFIAIAILLMLLIKIKYDALIILISVLIGSIFTLGFMLFFNIPLNFANIIGLPLLLGIGVDSGIHITERFYEEKNTQTNIYITSSMKGVIISSLTTIFSIGNLAFSSHQGTASMGLLLSVGLISMMFATMIVLPSFLIWRDSSYK